MSRKIAAGVLFAAGAFAAISCQDTRTPTDPASRPDLGRQAFQAVDVASLARGLPGFGGFYLDDGTPTVYLTDAGARGAAEAALAGYGYAPSAVRVRPADYAYQDLERWFQRLAPEALAIPGAVFADNDESSNRVVVGVEHAAAAASVRGVAARLGVPVEAVVVREVEPIQFAVTLRDRVRPIVGGLQIHFSNFLCTLGFNAVDGVQNSFITNSHCTDRQGGVQGTVYFQPLQSVDGTSIGTEVEDPQYQRNIPGCPRGRRCRRSDSSRAAYAGGISFDLGGIARTTGANNGSIEIAGLFNITSEDLRDVFTIGETMNKIGRTTGWTRGGVTNTCATVNVSGTNITQICQTLVSAGVGGGDSGSNVFRETGAGNVALAGILWGGNSSGTLFVFSPLRNIEQELGSLTTF